MPILENIDIEEADVVYNMNDFNKLSQSIEYVVFYDYCCYDEEIEELKLNEFSLLKRVIFGHYCFKWNTNRLIIYNLNCLETIIVDEDSFRHVKEVKMESKIMNENNNKNRFT